MVLDRSERLIGVVALDLAEGGQIQTVPSVINPDKLRHWARWPTSARPVAAAAAAEQSEGQQARQREHDPQRVGTGAGEPHQVEQRQSGHRRGGHADRPAAAVAQRPDHQRQRGDLQRQPDVPGDQAGPYSAPSPAETRSTAHPGLHP
jgi:hypothetical protein